MTGGSVCTALHVSCLHCQSCPSVGNLGFSRGKETSCVIPVDWMLTSFGCVGTTSRILRMSFSFRSTCKSDKKSAAVFILPGMNAMVKWICSTKTHAFRNGGGIILVWKNRVTDLLSVMTMTGFAVPRNICLNSLLLSMLLEIPSREWTFLFVRVNCFGTVCYWGIGFVCRREFLIGIVFSKHCISCCFETCIFQWDYFFVW